jgi:hypothetical protein
VLRKLLGRIDLGIGAVRMLHGQLKACKATWLRASNSHKDAARETGFFWRVENPKGSMNTGK